MTDCKQKTVFSEVEDISAICKRAAALCRAQPPKAALSESQRGLHTQLTNKPLRLTFVRPPFNSGMIAPGNHHFERFAALCNTPEGEPRRLPPALRGVDRALASQGVWRKMVAERLNFTPRPLVSPRGKSRRSAASMVAVLTWRNFL